MAALCTKTDFAVLALSGGAGHVSPVADVSSLCISPGVDRSLSAARPDQYVVGKSKHWGAIARRSVGHAAGDLPCRSHLWFVLGALERQLDAEMGLRCAIRRSAKTLRNADPRLWRIS